MSHGLRYAVNCSILFTEFPLLKRPAMARAAGFDAVEFWWPFTQVVPSDHEVESFIVAIEEAGVRLAALNLSAGELSPGERGLLSIPGHEVEFRDNLEVVIGIGQRLGTRAFNAPYGNRIEGLSPIEQDDLAINNLAIASAAVSEIDAVILVEPISGAARYPLRTAADVVAVIERARREAGAENLRLLADFYHLSVNGDNIDAVIADHAEFIGHVQIADAPGRHEPGSGSIDFGRHFRHLVSAGYRGWVALEYSPTTSTEVSFGWLSDTSGRGSGRD
jgi:hydroxypyruvate isomerase